MRQLDHYTNYQLIPMFALATYNCNEIFPFPGLQDTMHISILMFVLVAGIGEFLQKMPAVKGDGMRGLAVFISDIRNCEFMLLQSIYYYSLLRNLIN